MGREWGGGTGSLLSTSCLPRWLQWWPGSASAWSQIEPATIRAAFAWSPRLPCNEHAGPQASLQIWDPTPRKWGRTHFLRYLDPANWRASEWRGCGDGPETNPGLSWRCGWGHCLGGNEIPPPHPLTQALICETEQYALENLVPATYIQMKYPFVEVNHWVFFRQPTSHKFPCIYVYLGLWLKVCLKPVTCMNNVTKSAVIKMVMFYIWIL